MSGNEAGPGGAGGVSVAGMPAGGAVAGAVWCALSRSARPMTVRELAACVEVRRDSVGRALRMFERAGWARRERGDARCGIADAWSVAATAASMLDPAGADLGAGCGGRRGARAKMKAASSRRRGADGLVMPVQAESLAVDPPRRLAKGELQAMVLQILRDCVPEPLGVVALARRTGGRSQGAVADACERLVDQGQAVMIYGTARQYAAVERP